MHRSRWVGHLLFCAASYFCGLLGVPGLDWLTVPHAQAQNEGAAQGSDASSASDGPHYEEHIAQALQAYDAGRFAEARTLFRRAHELSPTARTLRTIGMCSFVLGDYLDAMQSLDAALTDPRKPLNQDQRANVIDLIARSQSYIGRFRVRLSPSNALLSVDGRPAPRLSSGELLLEPGRHELLAQASGYQPSRSTLQVDAGDRTMLEIRLEPADVAATAAPPPTASKLPSPRAGRASQRPTASSGSPAQAILGYVALGVGAAGLVGFGVTTGLAAAKASSLDEHCRNRECRPAYHDDVDSYDRYKLLSTISLIGGVVFASTGITLLLTQPDGTAERAALTPVIGLGTLGVRGQL